MHPIGLKISAGTYVTLFHSNLGWVMIDSGYGLRDYHKPSLVMRLFWWFTRNPSDKQMAVVNQLHLYGIMPDEIRHILLTHLHIDHAGGISDFPSAQIHVLQREYEAALQHRGRLGIGYDTHQWLHHANWCFYQEINATWFGMPAIQLPLISPATYLIPAPGHTPGHAMIAFQVGEKWVLQTGSAGYPTHVADAAQQARAPQWFKRWLMGDYQEQLQQLWQQHGDTITFLSSHEFKRQSNQDLRK